MSVSTEEKELLMRYKTAKENKERLTTEKTNAEKEFDTIKFILVEYLVERGQKSTAKYEGIGHVSLDKPEVRARVLKEDEEKLFEFLRENDYGAVIKPTVHHSTLSSAISELMKAGIEMPEFLKIDEVRTPKFFPLG